MNPLRILAQVLGVITPNEDTSYFILNHLQHERSSAHQFIPLASFERSRKSGPRGRPTQGGFRPTEENIGRLAEEECIYRFRFSAEEIVRLARVLRIPDPFITRSRHRFTRVEALCLLLARLRSAGDINDLVMMYDRAQGAISEVINEMAWWLDLRWGFLLAFDKDGILSPERIQSYADAIHERGAPISTIWGFIDCTIRAMCRPSLHQREAYNGYKKYHALKYQAVKLPNGMIGHLFGPEVGKHNDCHLLNESGILQWAEENALRLGTTEEDPPAVRFLQLYGDPAYGNNFQLLSPFAGPGQRTEWEKSFNEQMSAVRIVVEHGFGRVVQLFPFINAWWKHKVYKSPLGLYYRVAVLLTNADNCLHPNQTSQYFNLPPPTLEEYFHRRNRRA